ncbi:MAG: hypothetical protein H0U83_05110 [Sphingomonas sp.]|nr:hypothetical protein [Sphingomonas sp.]
MAESMWGLMTIILPIILLVGLVWLVFQRRSNKTTHKTEAGTRAEYDDEEQRRREGTDGL